MLAIIAAVLIVCLAAWIFRISRDQRSAKTEASRRPKKYDMRFHSLLARF